MDRPATELVTFAPKQKPGGEDEWVDQTGQALLALIDDAANLSKENIERAMTMAHRVSLELRAAEERIRELEAEVERFESHATRAEQWIGTIKKEIEDTLITPMEARRSKQQVLN